MVGRSFTACIRERSLHRVAPRRDGYGGSAQPALKGRPTFMRRSAAEELPSFFANRKMTACYR